MDGKLIFLLLLMLSGIAYFFWGVWKILIPLILFIINSLYFIFVKSTFFKKLFFLQRKIPIRWRKYNIRINKSIANKKKIISLKLRFIIFNITSIDI